ncbi:unnamed protein product [Oreochromis niloticus]|nr:unnamed protein product [Mustela putorius furo]
MPSASSPSEPSDTEHTLYLLDEWVAELRPQSPESLESEGEFRPLSLDSPVPQFRCPHNECNAELLGQRSVTPESAFSDWEDSDLCLEIMFDEIRPVSSQSHSSDFSLDLLSDNRALSPEFVSPGLDFSLLNTWLADFRASSPESVVSVHQCPHSSSMMLSPTISQHCNYYLQYSENRPTSPLSTMSDNEDLKSSLAQTFEDNRPDSPDSHSSNVEVKHSALTVKSSPLLPASRPLTYAQVVRGFTHDNECDTLFDFQSSDLRTMPSASSPSEPSDTEHTLYLLDEWVAELRPQSPESLESEGEFRPLSPDSPVPQFRCPHNECNAELLGQRSVTPESVFSDWEDSDLCLEIMFDEIRPVSSQSHSSDFSLDLLSDNRALSPEFVSPGLDFSLLNSWLADFRASSPESVVSVHQCPHSSSMMLSPTISQHCNYYLQYSENRPTSPLSTMSDNEDLESCLAQMFEDNRPDSPDSHSSNVEVKHTALTVKSSPLLPASRPLTYAQVVRGFTHDNECDTLFDFQSSDLRTMPSASSPSEPSDTEHTLYLLDEWVAELRPQSPESLESEGEFRPLSPDSPVPQFRCPHNECNAELLGQRSVTPESAFSDWEDSDLCLEIMFDEIRPVSSQSHSSDFSLDLLSDNRALSPEFVSPGLDFSLLNSWLADFRASSPESVVSVHQCPHSSSMMLSPTISQHCNYYLQYSEYRPTSPLSTMSDNEDLESCLAQMFEDNRPDSPDSHSSNVEVKHTALTVKSSPLLPASRPLTYAQVVRGFTHDNECDTLFDFQSSDLRTMPSASSPSEPSDTEHTLYLLDEWVAELRPQSPESLESEGEFRPLSPDSPVPQFRCPHNECNAELLGQRSVTPESAFSDWEDSDLCLEIMFDEIRPVSSQSHSSDFGPDSLSNNSPSSPENERDTTSSPRSSYAFREKSTSVKAFSSDFKPLSIRTQVHTSFLHSLPSHSYEMRYVTESSIQNKVCFPRLVSHLFDPMYKGKCSCSDIRFSETIDLFSQLS